MKKLGKDWHPIWKRWDFSQLKLICRAVLLVSRIFHTQCITLVRMEIGDQVFTNSVFSYWPHGKCCWGFAWYCILEQWGLVPKNQTCITTNNNGSNILCVVRSHLAWPYLYCFGHNLHLAISNSIKEDNGVQRALGVCRKIVTTFAHSWKKKRDLSLAQTTLDLPQHSFGNDYVTHWGSQQKMVERIL